MPILVGIFDAASRTPTLITSLFLSMAIHDTRSWIHFSSNHECETRFGKISSREGQTHLTKGGLQMEDKVELQVAVYRWSKDSLCCELEVAVFLAGKIYSCCLGEGVFLLMEEVCDGGETTPGYARTNGPQRTRERGRGARHHRMAAARETKERWCCTRRNGACGRVVRGRRGEKRRVKVGIQSELSKHTRQGNGGLQRQDD